MASGATAHNNTAPKLCLRNGLARTPAGRTGAVKMRNLLSLFAIIRLVSSFAPNVTAAELKGRILITKRIAKKRVTLPAYQLRGVSLAHEPDTSGSVNEYGELVVFLEGNLS